MNAVAQLYWLNFKTQEPHVSLGYRFRVCGLRNVSVTQKVLLDSSVPEGLAPEGFDGIRMSECLILELFS